MLIYGIKIGSSAWQKIETLFLFSYSLASCKYWIPCPAINLSHTHVSMRQTSSCRLPGATVRAYQPGPATRIKMKLVLMISLKSRKTGLKHISFRHDDFPALNNVCSMPRLCAADKCGCQRHLKNTGSPTSKQRPFIKVENILTARCTITKQHALFE